MLANICRRVGIKRLLCLLIAYTVILVLFGYGFSTDVTPMWTSNPRPEQSSIIGMYNIIKYLIKKAPNQLIPGNVLAKLIQGFTDTRASNNANCK
jgi:hypothetical protein